MKRFLRKLKLHTPDEMERAIIFRAQRNAYIFLAIALFLWSIYESYRVYNHNGRLNLLPCFLLVAAVIIQTLSRLVMTRNAVKDDEDSYETGPLINIVALLCVIFSIILTIVSAVVLTGVRL
jgi:hypothetical protein